MFELTQEEVRRHVSYDPATGVFVRVSSKWRTRIGCVAGTPDTKGHLQLKINGRLYLAHRLAWFLVHGEWPTDQIDHKNGIRDDNRIGNLRLATHRQNCQNRHRAPKNNLSTGLLGATFDKRAGRYFAQIVDSGKKSFLGYFDGPAEAHEAYLKAKAQLHEFGEIANSHRPQARREAA